MWHEASDDGNWPTRGDASISTSALLPALAGSWTSQKSVAWCPVAKPPWKMIPRGSLALRPLSTPYAWSYTLLPGNIVFDSPVRLLTCTPGLMLKNFAVLMSLGSVSPPEEDGAGGISPGVMENSV